jgi:hypothetical protein
VIDEAGCWIWKGAMQQGRPRLWCCTTGKSGWASKVLHLLHTGTELKPGRLYYATCGRVECVNPHHRKLGSPSDAGKVYCGGRKTAAQRATITLGHRRRQKLTQADVDEIRAASGSLREIGDRFGVHLSTVGRIKSGNRWAPVVSAASVFAWRP